MEELVSVDARRSLLDQPGVHAVGDSIRDSDPAVVVHTDGPARLAAVPETVEGVRVVVEEDEMARPTSRHADYRRPVEPGGETTAYDPDRTLSTGVGTLGFGVTDGQEVFATSNNHVLTDDMDEAPGFDVAQPADTATIIGTVADFVKIDGGPTTVDFSWVRLRESVGIDNSIIGIGEHSAEVVDPEVGDPVIYSGKNSGTNTGTVTEVNRWGTINADPNWEYEDCFAFEPAVIAGDSGAPVVLDDGEPYSPMGQVFAEGGTYTVAHKMSNVAAETGLGPVGEDHTPTPPMYQGRPRSEYTYCGTEQSVFEEWAAGEMSTERFEIETADGEGTGALVVGQCDDGNGDGGDDPPMYDGRPRSDYTYCGDEPDVFEQWVAGEITTSEFQTQTARGEGTAALTLGECDDDGGSQPREAGATKLVIGLGIVGAVYWYRNRG